MTSNNPDIHSIFNETIARDSEEERLNYLDEVCGNDPTVKRRVEALLRAHSEAGNFFAGQSPASPATNSYPITEKPGDMIGPYKLREQIGEGGMGLVFVAEQTEPVRRKVALKLIKPGMDTKQVIARFAAERQALALMDHANIAKVLDAGTTETGRPYFVMELVRGIPITEYCDSHQLTTRERLELFISVCRAVQHAHQKGIIHRDIKPGNVLVTQIDAKPVPKVIDFGVAKAINQELTEQTIYTQFAETIGTPLYMSPEQAEMSNIDVDTRSDVYSLGVVLYELLTGSTPFDRETLKEANLVERLRIIREDEPPNPSARISTLGEMITTVAEKRGTDPRKLSQAVRGDLDWIVMKAIEKDRNHRYESASAFAADVNRYLNDEPIEARPPSSIYRLKKFAKRKRAQLTSISLVAITLLVSLVVGSILVWNERTEMISQRTRAEKALQETRTTIDNYVETVQNAELLKEARFKTLMKELLKDALAYYQRFIKEHEHDDSSLLELSKAMFEAAQISESSGDVQEAIKAYEKVIEIQKKLGQENPAISGYHNSLALSLNRIGFLRISTGNPTKAMESFRQAITIWKRLVKANPTIVGYRGGLADSYRHVGDVLKVLGKPTEALKSYHQALAIRERLLEKYTTLDSIRYDVSSSYSDIARILHWSEKPTEKMKFYRKSLEIQEQLVEENPRDIDYRTMLGICHNDIAALLKLKRRFSESLEYHRKALSIFQELAKENPTITFYQNNLGMSHFNIGVVLNATDKPSEASESYSRSIAIFERLVEENHKVVLYQNTLIRCHFNVASLMQKTGNIPKAAESYRRAMTIYKRLTEENPEVVSYRSDLAKRLLFVGDRMKAMGKTSEARECYRQSILIYEQLVEENSEVEFQAMLSECYRHASSQLYWGLGNKTEGLTIALKAQIISKTLVERFPRSVSYSIGLGGDYVNLANYAADRNQFSQAEKDLKHGIIYLMKSLKTNPNHRLARLYLKNAHYLRGEIMEELERFDEAVSDYKKALEYDSRTDPADLHRDLQRVLGKAKDRAITAPRPKSSKKQKPLVARRPRSVKSKTLIPKKKTRKK